MKAPELIRNGILVVARRQQIDTHRLDLEAPWSRRTLGLFFGGITVLVMLASGTVNDIQP